MRPILPNMQLNERQNKLLASQVEHENFLGAHKCALQDQDMIRYMLIIIWTF